MRAIHFFTYLKSEDRKYEDVKSLDMIDKSDDLEIRLEWIRVNGTNT